MFPLLTVMLRGMRVFSLFFLSSAPLFVAGFGGCSLLPFKACVSSCVVFMENKAKQRTPTHKRTPPSSMTHKKKSFKGKSGSRNRRNLFLFYSRDGCCTLFAAASDAQWKHGDRVCSRAHFLSDTHPCIRQTSINNHKKKKNRRSSVREGDPFLRRARLFSESRGT
jgi:hypothetical protein